MPSHPLTNFEIQKYYEININLMVFIQEIIYQKKGWVLHGKPYFLFQDALKRWSFQKNCAETWSFLYYRERWYFLFTKIWSYALDGKWKMIFLKKYMEIWSFLQAFQKGGISEKGRAGTWSFLYYLERWYFFPNNMIFFHWAESERGPSQEVNGNMHRPAKKNRKPDL